LNALSSLLSENRLPEMNVVFVGAGNTVIIPAELKHIVTTTTKIPHHLAEQRIKESDANLLIVPKSISKYLPGKLYEYIASQKPVLAISAQGSEAANLISECNAGLIADFNDTDQIKIRILEIYDLWKSRKRLQVNMEYFRQYHRKEQVKKLEKLILEKL
jgi:glycosyltransferase involved in cell wall biosynthesis